MATPATATMTTAATAASSGPHAPPPIPTHIPPQLDDKIKAFNIIAQENLNQPNFDIAQDAFKKTDSKLTKQKKMVISLLSSLFMMCGVGYLFYDYKPNEWESGGDEIAFIYGGVSFICHLFDVCTTHGGWEYTWYDYVRLAHIGSYGLVMFSKYKSIAIGILVCGWTDIAVSIVKLRYGGILPNSIKYSFKRLTLINPIYVTADRLIGLGIRTPAELRMEQFKRLCGAIALDAMGGLLSVRNESQANKRLLYNEFDTFINGMAAIYDKDNGCCLC